MLFPIVYQTVTKPIQPVCLMTNILIFDGNVSFRQALAKMIDSRLPGVCIEETSDSAAGLEKLETFAPHLVFVDIHHPGLDGLAYVKKIKQIKPESIVIAFTRYDFPEYHATIHQSGADYFIPKDTWTGEEMLRLVESVIDLKDTEQEG